MSTAAHRVSLNFYPRNRAPQRRVTWDLVMENVFLRVTILSYLDWQDLLACEAVSLSWREIPRQVGRGMLWRKLYEHFYGLNGVTAEVAAGMSGVEWRDLFLTSTLRPRCSACGEPYERSHNSPFACRAAAPDRGGGWHVPPDLPPDLNPNLVPLQELVTCPGKGATFIFFFPAMCHEVIRSTIHVLERLRAAYRFCLTGVAPAQADRGGAYGILAGGGARFRESGKEKECPLLDLDGKEIDSSVGPSNPSVCGAVGNPSGSRDSEWLVADAFAARAASYPFKAILLQMYATQTPDPREYLSTLTEAQRRRILTADLFD